MAKVVLGVGTSHSPMLSTPPDLWPQHGERDKHNRELVDPRDGKVKTYEELVELTDPSIKKELTPEVFKSKHERCQKAITALGDLLARVKPDAVVIVSDDQEEMLFEDNMPTYGIYWGQSIKLIPWTVPDQAPPSIKAARWGYGDVEMDVPVASDLGLHLIESLMDQGFDVSHMRHQRDQYGGRVGPYGYLHQEQVTQPRRFGLPHGWSFVVKRLMHNQPTPIVPVFQNTCYPPNQPRPWRAYAMGQALRKAIESWDSDKRVCVLGSGGLSHFVVDEELDRTVLKAFEKKDAQTLKSLPRHRLQSAASEILNWVAVSGASEQLDFHMVDYVPVPRSPAGTGGGWCFTYWS